MNILRRVYERLVDVMTGTERLDVELPDEARQLVEEVAELTGVKPATVFLVIFAEAWIRKEGFAAIQTLLREFASHGAAGNG